MKFTILLFFDKNEKTPETLCTGVVVAVAFQKVDGSPDAETSAEGDNEGLKNSYCTVEKCHIFFLLDRK